MNSNVVSFFPNMLSIKVTSQSGSGGRVSLEWEVVGFTSS